MKVSHDHSLYCRIAELQDCRKEVDKGFMQSFLQFCNSAILQFPDLPSSAATASATSPTTKSAKAAKSAAAASAATKSSKSPAEGSS